MHERVAGQDLPEIGEQAKLNLQESARTTESRGVRERR